MTFLKTNYLIDVLPSDNHDHVVEHAESYEGQSVHDE